VCVGRVVGGGVFLLSGFQVPRERQRVRCMNYDRMVEKTMLAFPGSRKIMTTPRTHVLQIV